MENRFAPYELQFSVQERKEVVAEMLAELRKHKGLQQKEVAELLGISPQTYNGYEKGRNEPPIEVLVRLSFLYSISIDLIVQRDRLNKKDESMVITLDKMDAEIQKAKEAFKSSDFGEVKQLNDLMTVMETLSSAMRQYAEANEKQ